MADLQPVGTENRLLATFEEHVLEQRPYISRQNQVAQRSDGLAHVQECQAAFAVLGDVLPSCA